MLHLTLSPKSGAVALAALALVNLALPSVRVEGNTLVLAVLALATAYNSISENRARRLREVSIEKQNAKLDSIKITGEKTHTLSNSNMARVLKTVVLVNKTSAIALRRLADTTKADADIAAADAADLAVIEAQKVLEAHMEQQAIVDNEEQYRKRREKEV